MVKGKAPAASQQTIHAFGNSGAYGVSKAAVAALARSQAEAWSVRGVCVNTIGPAFVETPLTEAVFANPTRARAMAAAPPGNQPPADRLGGPGTWVRRGRGG